MDPSPGLAPEAIAPLSPGSDDNKPPPVVGADEKLPPNEFDLDVGLEEDRADPPPMTDDDDDADEKTFIAYS